MLSPTYIAAPPPAPYRAPAFVPAPGQRMPVATAPRAAVPAQSRPLVRAKGPDEPRMPPPMPLTIPSPEQLGVAVRSADTGLHGSAVQTRIKELGIVGYHLDWLPDGRARFTCWVPHVQPGVTRRVEVLAATETEAVNLGLQQAQQSQAGRP